jgi:cellulose synthase/poly-beta-1,6-N-acetylglucosamine synthase-like glycosyltransferase
MDEAEAQLRLNASTSGLADRVPLVSARSLVTSGQRNIVIGLVVAFVLGLLVSAQITVSVVIGIFTFIYVFAVVYRVALFMRSTKGHVVEEVSDEEALSVANEDLPFYSVLIPAYREAAVITEIIDNLARLNYPTSRLEILLLVEADDEETLEALVASEAGPPFKLIVIPPAEPRTKPKALNYGLTMARGDLVAVYDAEDHPDPLQLRRAAVALSRCGPEVACMQGKLTYGNAEQNFITKWFFVEYVMWYSFFLPGLSTLNAPIPLGGTSNHFRRSTLRSLGGWDPYNVTEDCDLGIRMFREGCTIKILESTTIEEANSDFVNWVKQRSRWYKGYLQTFLIHLRSPRETVRDMGWKGTMHLCAFVGGTPILAIFNPLFWGMTVVWFLAHPSFIQEVFPAPVYYVSLFSWAFGNVLLVYLTMLTARHTGVNSTFLPAMLVPFYWVMMSVAGLKAIWQLVVTPSFWEKTTHGLSSEPREPAIETAQSVTSQPPPSTSPPLPVGR